MEPVTTADATEHDLPEIGTTYFIVYLPVRPKQDDAEWSTMQMHGMSTGTRPDRLREQFRKIKLVQSTADQAGFERAEPRVQELSHDEYQRYLDEHDFD